MVTASIRQEQYRTEIKSAAHVFYADEPLSLNGTDTAPSPEDLLDAALASCTAITLRMYVARKNWPLAEVEVYVSHERENNHTRFARHITLHGQLSDEQRQRLLQIAKACPVSKILEGTTQVQTTLNL